MKDGVGLPEGDQAADKLQLLAVGFRKTPIQPGNLIILAVSVVIPLLGISELVSRQKEGRSLA